jgi:hypothetical protein
LPAQATFDTTPARLLRGILAHLLAAKLAPDTCLVDQAIREFLSGDSPLAPNVHLFYWLYPFSQISVVRDFSTVCETGNGRKAVFCSIMKFPPLAMFMTDVDYFHGLPDLTTMSHFSIDDPGRVDIEFDSVRPQAWPEATKYSGFIVMGQAGTQSIHGVPRNA